ncbi:MAG TPA: hypothetical protein VFD43_12370 [Planctomycetota bacterium]|nr:hypothetical protein [Planctomycetota bacterium]
MSAASPSETNDAPCTRFNQERAQGRAERPHWRRGCLRAVGWGCGTILALVLLLVTLAKLPGLLVDGDGLATRLQQALAGSATPEFHPGYADGEIALLPEGLTLADVERRARTVSGWDVLAVIAPYGHGAELADEPGILWTPSWVPVSNARGFPQESVYLAYVIRSGFVVSSFLFSTDKWLGSFVARRE